MIAYNEAGSLRKISNIYDIHGMGNPDCTLMDRFYKYSFNKDRVLNDNFGLLNKYRSIDFADREDKFSIAALKQPCFDTFEYLVDKRINELANRFDHLTVLWSGGCDSCTVVASLIKNEINRSKYTIVFNDLSIEESPQFYTFMQQQNLPLHNVGHIPIYEYLNNAQDDTVYVNGCPEQIFQYPIACSCALPHYWKHWKHGIIDNLAEKGITLSSSEKNELIGIFEEYLKELTLDYDVAYTIDLLWLVCFSGMWNYTKTMFKSHLQPTAKYGQSCVNFFDTFDFAHWALQNSLNHSPYDNWLEYGGVAYRKPEKRYIQQVFKHQELTNKIKVGSQTREHSAFGVGIDHISVYHDTGAIVFPYNPDFIPTIHELCRK